METTNGGGGHGHNLELGMRGEDVACLFLERRGLEILERNWRCKSGEADIIALDTDALVFVEVKTRSSESNGLPEEAVTPDEEAAVVTTYITDPEPEPSSPYTWEYLATIAGATAFTLLVAQFLKFPLDKVWKIPTRILVYVIALIVMLVATAFTGGLTLSAAGLAVANAFVVAFAAYGAYEVTFARVDR